MPRTTPRPPPPLTQTLPPVVRPCPCGGAPLWAASHHSRPLTTLEALMRLTLQRRRCLHPACPQVRPPYRPAAAGRLALPQHACGLAVLPGMGPQRSAPLSRVPTLQQALGARGRAGAPRTVTQLVERSDARVARAPRHGTAAAPAAASGARPPGPRWPPTRCGPGRPLGPPRGSRGRGAPGPSLPVRPPPDCAARRREGTQALAVPLAGGLPDGPRSLRAAVAPACPEGPHPRCPGHARHEAAKPLSAAARHATQGRKNQVRGVRPRERAVEGRPEPEAEVLRGDCSAVRSARTDEGRPPVAAAGRHRPARLTARVQSLERVATRGPCPQPSDVCRRACAAGWTRPRRGGPRGGGPRAGAIAPRPSGRMTPQRPGPPCSGGGTGGAGPEGHRTPTPGPSRLRWSTFCRAAGAPGPACCMVRTFPPCPAPRMSWSSFVAPRALMSAAPRGAQWLRPPWGCAEPSDSSPGRPPAYAHARATSSPLTRSGLGQSSATRGRPVATSARRGGACAGIPLPLSRHERQTFSRCVCRPSFFKTSRILSRLSWTPVWRARTVASA
jgi:hypothetical protein